MNSRNQLIKSMYLFCCQWGKPVKKEREEDEGPVPLVKNPSKQYFCISTVINLLSLVALVIIFIYETVTENNHIDEIKAELVESGEKTEEEVDAMDFTSDN